MIMCWYNWCNKRRNCSMVIYDVKPRNPINNHSSLYTIRTYYSFETDRIEEVIERKSMNPNLQTHTSHPDQK